MIKEAAEVLFLSIVALAAVGGIFWAVLGPCPDTYEDDHDHDEWNPL